MRRKDYLEVMRDSDYELVRNSVKESRLMQRKNHMKGSSNTQLANRSGSINNTSKFFLLN